ncbi:MAG: hypothetical protein HY647_10250 [Acidobacteria bacterium]|nr:hypothetical protein [Acidobacteriota bacterium]
MRHEMLDARDYAALRALVSMGLVLDAEADRIATLGASVREQRPTPPRVSRSQWMNA